MIGRGGKQKERKGAVARIPPYHSHVFSLSTLTPITTTTTTTDPVSRSAKAPHAIYQDIDTRDGETPQVCVCVCVKNVCTLRVVTP